MTVFELWSVVSADTKLELDNGVTVGSDLAIDDPVGDLEVCMIWPVRKGVIHVMLMGKGE